MNKLFTWIKKNKIMTIVIIIIIILLIIVTAGMIIFPIIIYALYRNSRKIKDLTKTHDDVMENLKKLQASMLEDLDKEEMDTLNIIQASIPETIKKDQEKKGSGKRKMGKRVHSMKKRKIDPKHGEKVLYNVEYSRLLDKYKQLKNDPDRYIRLEYISISIKNMNNNSYFADDLYNNILSSKIIEDKKILNEKWNLFIRCLDINLLVLTGIYEKQFNKKFGPNFLSVFNNKHNKKLSKPQFNKMIIPIDHMMEFILIPSFAYAKTYNSTNKLLKDGKNNDVNKKIVLHIWGRFNNHYKNYVFNKKINTEFYKRLTPTKKLPQIPSLILEN